MTQITPMFHDDLEELKRAVRLTGSDPQGDVAEVLSDAVRGFRVWLTRRAGFSVVSTLQAVTFTEAPATQDELRRMAAKLLEEKWVWSECLKRLQTMFADSSGSAFQEFNDQGVWRQVDPLQQQRILRRVEREIEDLYSLVAGFETVGDHSEIQTFDGSAESQDYFFPAGTAFPCLGKFRGNFYWPAWRFVE